MGGEPNAREKRHAGRRSVSREELRTIAFRLRELQRLLSVRVEQENRRLEAEGIRPVETNDFFTPGRTKLADGADGGEAVVEALSTSLPFETIRLTLGDGRSIAGRIVPVVYSPDEELRLELRPRHERETRFHLRADCREGRWSVPRLRRHKLGEDEWSEVGIVEAVQTPTLG